jgi:hypothetical protein
MFESVTSLQEETWLRSFEGTDLKGAPRPVSACWELDGAVDENALSEALYALTMRHEGLRRSFPWLSDDPLRAWVDSDVVVPVQVMRAVADEETTRRDLLDALMTPFDVRAAPLWRVVLVKPSEYRSYVGFSADHMICDGISLSVFLKELALAYGQAQEGRPIDLGPPASAYSDFARRQRDAFAGAWGEERRAFWTEYVSKHGKYPPECGLALPQDDRAAGGPGRSQLLRGKIDAATMKETGEVARRWRVTKFALVTSTVLTAMTHVLGDSRAGLSLDVHGRLLPGSGAGIGLFSHGVPLNVDLPEDSCARDRAGAVADALAEMLRYGVPLRGACPKWGLDITRSHASNFVLYKFNATQWADDFQLGDIPARICRLRPPKEQRSIWHPGFLELEATETPEGFTVEAHFDDSTYAVPQIQEWLDRTLHEIQSLATP